MARTVTKINSRQVKSTANKHEAFPIKNYYDVERLLYYFEEKKDTLEGIKQEQAYRNYIAVLLGINTGLRAEDLLQLQVRDVSKVINIPENKTRKKQQFQLHPSVLKKVDEYIEHFKMKKIDYLFWSQQTKYKEQNYTNPITRRRFYEILTEAANALGIRETIGSHTLRKTFAYHYLQQGGNLLTLQAMLNHSTPQVTLRYVMWDDADVYKDRKKVCFGL